MHTFLEMIHRHFRYAYEACTMLHALSVLLGSEDVDGLVIGTSEGFQSFVALLAIVEAGCHAMNAQERVFDESGRSPLAGLDGIVGLDVAVDYHALRLCSRNYHMVEAHPRAL